ncbi:MAG TPA: hypothetical protein VI893_10125 [Thermoplasmata archaeon]|nr:hypothetical protein [Thermoplasmata archaeon]
MQADKSPEKLQPKVETPRSYTVPFGKCGSCNAQVGGAITSRFVTHVTCSMCRKPTCLVCMRLRRSRPICKACEGGSKKHEDEGEAAEHLEE